MQEVGLQDVFASIEQAFAKNDFPRVEALLWPALDQFPHEGRLWFYGGGVKFKQGHVAVAAALFQRAIELDDAPHMYSNLGACMRRLNLHDEGIHVLTTATEKSPDYGPALVNLGSMFVNEGCPERGIPYLERAARDPEAEGAEWNLGLLYLEAGRFAEGFEMYRRGVKRERAVRMFGSEKENVPEPELMTPEIFDKAGGATVIVYGEQGIGDELMFCTILNQAIHDFDIILECHPRLERLHRNSTWANELRRQDRAVRIYPTRKENWIRWPIDDKVHAHYKMPIGDLARYYRPDLASFKDAWNATGPTYTYSAAESLRYGAKLRALAGDRPIIGLATKGGVIQTSRNYRIIGVKEIDRLMTETDALFVSLDYDDMTGLAEYIDEKYGPERYRWFPSILHHWDYDHTAALVGACDLAVTVCQSVAHLAAYTGEQVRILTARKVAWREIAVPGNDPEEWYWAPSKDVRMYRQDEHDSWEPAITKVIADIRALSDRPVEVAA
jgi:tetratricopeptide (TPR) repeat protein